MVYVVFPGLAVSQPYLLKAYAHEIQSAPFAVGYSGAKSEACPLHPLVLTVPYPQGTAGELSLSQNV